MKKFILTTTLLLTLIICGLLVSSQVMAQGGLDRYRNMNDCLNNGISAEACASYFFSNSPIGQGGGITNPAIGNLGNNPAQAAEGITFTKYFVTIWRAIVSISGIAVLVYFLWGAFEWIVAGGEQSKIQKARDKITNAIIGLMLLVGSFAIVGFAGTLIGYNVLEVSFPAPN